MGSVNYEDKGTVYERFPEKLPQQGTVPSLEEELRIGAKERIAKRKRDMQLKKAAKQPVVPTVCKLVFPSPGKYKKCQHSGNFILDRQVLKPSDHTDLIAMPKEKTQQKSPYYIVRKLPSVTNRIKTLARPGLSHVKATLEGFSSRLSDRQQQHLQNLLEPKPFVTIQESIGYAKQQRSDDAMWRRHLEKKERKLLRKIHRLEIQLLRKTMQNLSKKLRDYYLLGSCLPLEENGKRIARAVLRCVCRFLEMPVPNMPAQDNPNNYDVIEDFYIEFSEKVGHWIWRLMETTGISFDKQKSHSLVRKSDSFVSVNSSEFELRTVDEGIEESELELLCTLSSQLIEHCLSEAVLEVESQIVPSNSMEIQEAIPSSTDSAPTDDLTLDEQENIQDTMVQDIPDDDNQTDDEPTNPEPDEKQSEVL